MGAEATSFAGRRALVLGLGRFGGGVETARFLLREGAQVLISDAATRADLEAPAEAAEALGARLVFGPQTDALLDGIDVVFASPALPFDHTVVAEARRRGIPVTTETNELLLRCPAPVFGVTGTKGKSTTTTLLARMLEAAGHTVHLGGNIGKPLLGHVHEIASSDRMVLELSSFQLWWAHAIRRAPHLTLITNLMSDHLDRHGTQEEYARSKRAALDYQGAADVAVLPADDDAVRAAGWFQAGAARRVTFGIGGDVRLEGTELVDAHGRASCEALSLPGAHNRRNALAAAAAALQDGATTWQTIEDGLRATRPLPHRLDPVAEIDGVRYVDDSNATHPESTCVALAAFDAPIVLLAGGKDKGADTTRLHAAIVRRAKAFVGLGTTGPTLAAAVSTALPSATHAPDMAQAVEMAQRLAAPGDVVLLSPGYSSLDQFQSFAERGDTFRKVVERLADRV